MKIYGLFSYVYKPINLLNKFLLSNKNTLFIGKVLHHFASLESTNQYALDLISKSKPIEGTVISTFNQTKGRGQIGSTWQSDSNKNITLSLILYPGFLPVQRQFALNQMVALAVRTLLLQHSSKNITVKWPNDIFINDKKVAGILIQNSLSGKKIASTVIGIGLNVNQESFSDELSNATSLKIETDSDFDLNNLIQDLCFYLETRYLQLKGGRFDQINQAYLDCLYKYQEPAFFERPDGFTFKGIIQGLSENGKLIIKHTNGLEEFDLKEIMFKQ